MSERSKISMAVIRRLPKYHRYLKELLDRDIKRISSKELSDIIGFTASQIRQDLNNFGGFGQQGYGYNVEELFYEIGKILGLDKTYKTIIVGAGNLGQALANYTNFDKVGFEVKALFDINPKLFGIKIRDIEIKDMDYIGEYIKENGIDIAILCINKDNAQDVTDKLVSSGVEAIWNFTPTDLKVPENVIVENVHLVESLLTLTYLYKSNNE
ncbi:redox-sensing transcriptional repressor Rex [Wukongibacter baidiensis]|uniref:redox-sensing transcriptional repressor Rex n=1 Tax=Wukongibacter baidiensis TaxID=1723361 RepID=UPI003D7FD969